MNELIIGRVGATTVHIEKGNGGILLERYETSTMSNEERKLFNIILLHNGIDNPSEFTGYMEIYEVKKK